MRLFSSSQVGGEEILAAVWRALEKLYGEYGASKAGLGLMEFDEKERCAILRVMKGEVEMLRAALASITKIGEAPVSLSVLRVSGTIKSLRDKSSV